jgi:hypothetical protein
MMFQLNEGWLTYRYELHQFSLAEPFLFAECRNSLTDMLPWGKVPSNNIEVKYVEYLPKRGQVAPTLFQ